MSTDTTLFPGFPIKANRELRDGEALCSFSCGTIIDASGDGAQGHCGMCCLRAVELRTVRVRILQEIAAKEAEAKAKKAKVEKSAEKPKAEHPAEKPAESKPKPSASEPPSLPMK